MVEFRLPLEENTQAAWKFVYETFNQITCLTSVNSPIGLLEEVQYNPKGHQLPNRAPYETIPYVISHVARPSKQHPHIKTQICFL